MVLFDIGSGRDNDNDSELKDRGVSSRVRRLCGGITTDNGNGECELFRKVRSMGKYVDVHSNGCIPLSRAVVAAPFGGILRVEALLHEYDDDGQVATFPTAEGVVGFSEPSSEKEETKVIEGCHGGGGVAVKLLWM